MLQLSCLEKSAIRVLRQGKIPRHIAFIMDGNRRFAKKEKKESLSGHIQGTKTLKKCLLYCLQLGVQYASFYAFSIQNFNRNKEEVSFLMKLARQQFEQLAQIYEQDNIYTLVMKNNVKVVIAGDLQGTLKEQFPDIRENFAKLQQRTKNNTKMTLYICFAYDSIYQINRAIEECHFQDEQSQTLSCKQKEEKIFSKLLVPHYIDILIRTSNQWRLSNFMLMQSKYALVQIEKKFWPSFNLFTLAKILMKYNFHYKEIQIRRIATQVNKND